MDPMEIGERWLSLYCVAICILEIFDKLAHIYWFYQSILLKFSVAEYFCFVSTWIDSTTGFSSKILMQLKSAFCFDNNGFLRFCGCFKLQ